MKGLSRAWVVCVAIAGVAAPLAPAFTAAPAAEPRGAPDTETLNRLQSRFQGGRRARLVTSGGERILVSPVFTLDGVRSTEPDADLALVSWSEIERIDARGGRPKAGAIIGGIAGLGFGLFVGFASALGGESGNGASQFVGATLIWTGIGVTGGAALGAVALRGGWAQVYPEKQTGSSWGLQKRK